jgi:hypothetical protein
MSLIADALKAAQKEKARRSPPPRAPQQGYFPFRFPTRSSGEPIVSPLVIGIGVATAAVALTARVLVFSPSRKPATRPPVFAPVPDTAAATMVLEAPGDTAALALLDTTEIAPADGVDLETYEDEPPPRRVASAPARSASTTRRESDPAPGDPLPPIASSAPPIRSGTETGGRLQITVDQPTRGSSGSGLFEQGLAAQRRGDFETAKNRYLQATYEQPRNLELWNNLGTVYRALRDLSGAEGAFRTATEIVTSRPPGTTLASCSRSRVERRKP